MVIRMATIKKLNQAIRTIKDHCVEHEHCDNCELRNFCDLISDGIFPYDWSEIDEEKADKKKNNVAK